MNRRVTNNFVFLVLIASGAASCGIDGGTPMPDEGAVVDEATFGAEGEKADRASTPAWRSNLFVKYGLYKELEGALAARFTADYRIHVPGVLEAFVSYGGDMLSTVQPAGVELERIWDPTPGGAVFGVLQSSGWVGGNPKGAHQSAMTLFNAMTRARETRTFDDPLTKVERSSAQGRVKCVKSTYQRRSTYRCAFKDLLSLNPL